VCDLPTGLGKTSVIAIWLLGLAERARTRAVSGFPRRLVYVVNRRTVVDQATGEVEAMRSALTKPGLRRIASALRSLAAIDADQPLAISTLRGQFADNAQWRSDPARPAVVIGTVDMIGSRLLFSGYGCGFKSRPFHAGLLGQDALLVHDEAHLEPAFQELITAIEREQRRAGDLRPIRVMALTATARAGDRDVFSLTAEDRKHEVVKRRIKASKRLALHEVPDAASIAGKMTELALRHDDAGAAVLVFARRVEDVDKVARGLPRGRVQMLTGTIRGLERDRLTRTDPIFARFVREPGPTAASGTVYLVCTSAGEVGVNISADQLVSDLASFDSMAQRLGRVNRFGDGNAEIDVVHADLSKDPGRNREDTAFAEACRRTLDLLKKLPQRKDGLVDASPHALSELDPEERRAAFTPRPVIRGATDILFDAWAMTTPRGRGPGRPDVEQWLHGIRAWEPPESHVAWRDEVGVIRDELLDRYAPDYLLEDYPLKPHELLRDRSDRVLKRVIELARRAMADHADRSRLEPCDPPAPVWLVRSDGVEVVPLAAVANWTEDDISGRTVLLAPAIGGLTPIGQLDADAPHDAALAYDVADQWSGEGDHPLRQRLWDADPPPGMRFIARLDTSRADEALDDVQRRYWCWCVVPKVADDDGSRASRSPLELARHLELARGFAAAITAKLGLDEKVGAGLAAAIALAAKWHDVGKARAVWQRSIGNLDYPANVLAKSGGKMCPRDLTAYRHELGSIIDAAVADEIATLPASTRDLVLHAIAAHHGRGRPWFPAPEVFDPERPADAVEAAAREVPRRFVRLQRAHGRWGLAYLESLMRAADILASQVDALPQVAIEGGAR
jgi:CRISPR-associated endonuclease/helicase Cas3